MTTPAWQRPENQQPYRYCTLLLRSGAPSVALAEYQRQYIRADHKRHYFLAHGFPTLKERFPERVKITVRYAGTVATLWELPQEAWPIQSIELGWVNVSANNIDEETTFDYWDGGIRTLTLKHLEIVEVSREALGRRETALENLERTVSRS